MKRARDLERTLQHALVRPWTRLLARPRVPADRVDLGAVRRVLLLRPNFRMGNLLLATPALTAIRRALPDAEIHLLAGSSYADLFRRHPDLDRVLALERSARRRPGSWLSLVRSIRRTGYDLVIDGAGGASTTSAFFARLAGARWTVAAAEARCAPHFDVRVPVDASVSHVIERLAAILEGIGIPCARPEMSLALEDHERAWARRWWRERDLPEDGTVVGVQVSARDDKRWPLEKHLGLVRRLSRSPDLRLVVFSGLEDAAALARAAEGLPSDVIAVTPASVPRFAALLERCALVITGDTGPMHLAAAVGVSTVSIFLRDNDAVYAPLGPDHRSVRGGTGVDPSAVLDAAVELLPALDPRRA